MSAMEQIFRVGAEDDTIYIAAFCREDAEKVFRKHFGDVPSFMLRWKVVSEVPDGEEALR